MSFCEMGKRSLLHGKSLVVETKVGVALILQLLTGEEAKAVEAVVHCHIEDLLTKRLRFTDEGRTIVRLSGSEFETAAVYDTCQPDSSMDSMP